MFLAFYNVLHQPEQRRVAQGAVLIVSAGHAHIGQQLDTVLIETPTARDTARIDMSLTSRVTIWTCF